MKKIKLFLGLIGILLSFTSVGVVKAVNAEITSSTENHKITITRNVTGVKSPVTNTFTYTITPSMDNPGVVTGAPTELKIYFSAKEPTTGTQISSKSGSIDFAGTTFERTGDYLFTITETGSADNISYPIDQNNSYVVKVAVRNKSANDFSSKDVSIFIYQGTSQSLESKVNNGVTTFEGPAVLRKVTITNQVSGSMADSDLYFAIDVTINAPGTFTINGGTFDEQPSTISGQKKERIYLKHGESVEIGGLVQGTLYTLEEASSPPFDEYLTTIGGEAGKTKEGIKVGVVDTTIAITNAYEGTALTGGTFKQLPYIIIVSVVVLLIVIALVIRHHKIKKFEEELDSE